MRRETRLLSLLPLFALILINCQNTSLISSENAWDTADEIVKNIKLPEFQDAIFLLSDFGGIGDGLIDNKEIFDSIVSFCHDNGGGRIIVNPGTYLVNGPIHLKSNVNLHLEEGAKIVFGNNPDFYLPVVLTSWEGTRLYNYSPFIYAYQASNVAITGKGEIDGEASETWQYWKDLQNKDKRLSRKMNNESTALEERVFGTGHFLRPHLIQFYECEKILVEGVKISDSPFWCLHLVFSKNITIRNLIYDAYNFNNDGIDPESSENILIENIIFDNKDDNIAIKAGRDLEARTLNIPSKNIVVRNCKFKGHNALAIGSEMSGGVNNVFVEDCSYAGNVIYGFYLKGNRDRGGEVHDIYARNLEFDSTRSTIIIDSNYKNQGSCCPPLFKNIFVEKVTANYASDHGIYLQGYKERPLDSITIRNITIKEAATPLEYFHVNHLLLDNVKINGLDFSNIEKDIDGENDKTVE